MREGKSERQVLEELGDPRLLAKSIITASGASRDEEYYEDDVLKFDYKIKDGRCTTTNAKAILRMAGFNV